MEGGLRPKGGSGMDAVGIHADPERKAFWSFSPTAL
jgi:hypothetical protein